MYITQFTPPASVPTCLGVCHCWHRPDSCRLSMSSCLSLLAQALQLPPLYVSVSATADTGPTVAACVCLRVCHCWHRPDSCLLSVSVSATAGTGPTVNCRLSTVCLRVCHCWHRSDSCRLSMCPCLPLLAHARQLIAASVCLRFCHCWHRPDSCRLSVSATAGTARPDSCRLYVSVSATAGTDPTVAGFLCLCVCHCWHRPDSCRLSVSATAGAGPTVVSSLCLCVYHCLYRPYSCWPSLSLCLPLLVQALQLPPLCLCVYFFSFFLLLPLLAQARQLPPLYVSVSTTACTGPTFA